MSDKCILLIDMDGVTADWYGGFLEIYKTQFPERQTIPPEKMDEYYVEDKYDEKYKQDCLKIVRGTVGFYENLKPIEGAIEALNTIKSVAEEGIVEPYLCSSPDPVVIHHSCESEKARWVSKHLGPWWDRRLILTNDKTLVRGHFLIDDKPVIRGVMKPTWTRLLYTQPHNAHINSEIRFVWSELPNLILSIRSMTEMIKEEKNKPNIIVPSRGIVGNRRG